jgi:CBS domain-containing protein
LAGAAARMARRAVTHAVVVDPRYGRPIGVLSTFDVARVLAWGGPDRVPGRSIRIARIAGIPVGTSPWWLVIVALLTWSIGVDFLRGARPGAGARGGPGLALASVLAIFGETAANHARESG